MRNLSLLPLACLLLVAAAAPAQPLGRKVSLSYRNEPLGSVLSDISQQYEVRFSYSPYYVPVDKPVTVRIVNKPLGQALDTLFSQTAIVYSQVGGQIVLRVDRQRLAQLEALRQRPAPTPVPLVDERMAAERRRLRSQMPDLEKKKTGVSAGGDYWREIDLDRYRIIVKTLEETEESKEATESKSNVKVAQVSLLPFLGSNTHRSDEITNHLSLNILWGTNGGVDGVEVGGLVNSVVNQMTGLQMAGLGNTVGGDMTGTQAAGMFNVNRGFTRGVQLAGMFNVSRFTDAVQVGGLFNLSRRDAYGVQAAGLFNVSRGRAGVQVASLFNTSSDSTQTQVASLFNSAGDVEGAQISLLFNKARRMNGLQIGIINVADSVGGVSLGLLNFVRHGYNRVELSFSDAFFTGLGLKLGTKGFYNILQVGARWDKLNRKTLDGLFQNGVFMTWGLGYGLGSAVQLNHKWLMNIEAVAIHVNEQERWTSELNLLNQLRLSFDCRHRSHNRVSYFIGPVANLMVSKKRDAETGLPGSSLAPYTLYDKTSGATNTRFWLGVNGGIRF